MAHTMSTPTCDPYGSLKAAKGVASFPHTYAANQKLDPPNAAAGTLPATVMTDANGIANFNLTYLKSSAPWIEAALKASTRVLGSETASTTTFLLHYIQSEGVTGFLPDPTFGQ